MGPLNLWGLALVVWARGSVYRQPASHRCGDGSLGEKGGQEPVAGRAKPWDPHA